MRGLKNVIVKNGDSILTTMRVIDFNALQIALVVNEDGKLLGTVTDGDIRKAVLTNRSLDENITDIMNKKPITSRMNERRDRILAKMNKYKIHQIPILDKSGYLVGLEILSDIMQVNEQDNWVCLMAGGLGSRLGALTENCPKPLLNIGSKPILELIMENFIENGYRNFYFSINYRANMIQEYFKDGSDWGVNITYILENKRMGTAGALSMLPEKPNQPMIVMNGDILTKFNFNQLMEFHKVQGSKATMCVRDYSIQIPYGVVQIEDQRLTGIVEKPTQSYYISAGIYVLDPIVLDFIPKDDYFDMPDLFQKLITEKTTTFTFPLRDYWIDIGNKVDYDKANGGFDVRSDRRRESEILYGT